MHQQQSVLPGAYPDAAVTGLQHPQAATVAFVTDADGLKPVVQAVQPLDSRTAPVGDGPYLVDIVDHHLSRPVEVCLQRIRLGQARLDSIVPHAVLHGRYPETTLLVQCQTGHRRVDLHRQTGELLVGLCQAEHAFLRSSVDGILTGQQGRDILVHAQLRDAVGLHLTAVIAAEPVVGAKPDEAVWILYDVTNGVGCQTVVHGQVTVTVVIPRHDRQEEHDTGQQQYDSFHRVQKYTKYSELARSSPFILSLLHLFIVHPEFVGEIL